MLAAATRATSPPTSPPAPPGPAPHSHAPLVPAFVPSHNSATTQTQPATASLTPGDWVVLDVGIAAAVISLVAAVIAYKSWRAGLRAAEAAEAMVREAERLRREQAQPYVVVFTEPSGKYDLIDLVIKNLGKTAARDVRLKITPTPTRAATDEAMPREVWIPTEIPVLVPQQEWRTGWDFGKLRRHAELPDRYNAVLTFTDSRGHGPNGDSGRFSYLFVLDWGIYWGQVRMSD